MQQTLTQYTNTTPQETKRETLIKRFREARKKEDEEYEKQIATIEAKKQELQKQLEALQKQYEMIA